MRSRVDPNKITYERWLYWKELVDVCRCYLGWNRLSKAIGSPNAGYVQKAYEYRNVAQDDDIPRLEDVAAGLLRDDRRVAWTTEVSDRHPVVWEAITAAKPHKVMDKYPLYDCRAAARAMLELAKAATGNDDATETDEMSNRNHGRACNDAEAAEFRALAHALVTHFNYTPMRLAIACGYHENSTANLRRAMDEGGVPSITKLEAVRAHYRDELGQEPADVLLMLADEPKGRPGPDLAESARAALDKPAPTSAPAQENPLDGLGEVPIRGRRENEPTAAWLTRAALDVIPRIAVQPLEKHRAAELKAAVDAMLAEMEAVRKAPPCPAPAPAAPEEPMEAARASLWAAVDHLTAARGTPPNLTALPPYAREAVRGAHERACDDAAERIANILTTLE